MYDTLITTWTIDPKEYDAFGRCYRNQAKNGSGYIPEVFKGGKDYGDPLLNDRISVSSFFGVSGVSKHDLNRSIAKVHMIFCLNVEKIKPTIVHRGDEEIHQDILQALKDHSYLYHSIESTEQWMDNVFREYSSTRTNDKMKFRDMHPFHCYRVNMSILYQDSNCV